MTQVFYIDETFYLLIITLTKLSFLFFYLRIFPVSALRIAIFITMACIIVGGLVIMFMQIFQCIPINFLWEGWAGDFGAHKCLNINALTFAAGGMSIVQDVVILALPIPVLVNLQAPRRAKAGILFMFSLGILICITSCIRLRYLVIFAKSTNPTWDYTDAMIWSSIEVCVSIIVTSLPAMRVLLSKLRPGLFGTRLGTRGQSNQSRLTATDLSLGDPRKKSASQSAKSRIFSLMGRLGTSDTGESQVELGLGPKGDLRTATMAGDCKSQETGSDSGPLDQKRSRSGSIGTDQDGMSKPLPVTTKPMTQMPVIYVTRSYSTTTTRLAEKRGLEDVNDG